MYMYTYTHKVMASNPDQHELLLRNLAGAMLLDTKVYYSMVQYSIVYDSVLYNSTAYYDIYIYR